MQKTLLPFYSRNLLEAGVDEAGRGCLAGPVVAAAVILKKGFAHPMIQDSKILTHRQRVQMEEVIKNESVAWGIGVIDNLRIDEINILNATFHAMNKAIKSLESTPELILIDGNRFISQVSTRHKCIIRGDSIFASIAAASILAKTYRDRLMEELHLEYPVYNWKRNKGYPTGEHRKVIHAIGLSPYHRKTFHLHDKSDMLIC